MKKGTTYYNIGIFFMLISLVCLIIYLVNKDSKSDSDEDKSDEDKYDKMGLLTLAFFLLGNALVIYGFFYKKKRSKPLEPINRESNVGDPYEEMFN